MIYLSTKTLQKTNDLPIYIHSIGYMKMNQMDIGETLKQENQRFWDLLILDTTLLNRLEDESVQIADAYIIEEIESI